MSGCCSLLNDFFCLYWDDLIKRFFFSLFVNMRNYSDWLLNIKPTVNRFFPDGSPAVSPLLPYPPSPSPSFFLPSSLLCSSSFSSCLFSDYFSCHLFSSSSLIWGVLLKCHCFMHCGYIFLDTHYLIQGLFLFAKQGIVPRLCITSFHHLCGSTVLREMETERMWWVCLCECVCVCARLCEYLCVSVSVWVCLCVCVCVTASVWVCLCVCASVWVRLCVRASVCVSVWVHLCECICVRVSVWVHLHECVCVCARLCECVCVCTHLCVCLCVCACADGETMAQLGCVLLLQGDLGSASSPDRLFYIWY